MEFKDKPVTVTEELVITDRDVGKVEAVLGPPKPPPLPGIVCKACGKILEARGVSRGGVPLPQKIEDAGDCDDVGPHVHLLVDLRTARFDKDGRVVRAVHLE